MSRSELYHGRDLTYSGAHRSELPQLYQRVGHRADAADRDWTEFCHYCREPLAIYEEVRDRGQDIADKNTHTTRRLAELARLPASLVAWRSGRPREVQRELDALHRRAAELERAYPIEGITTRGLWPRLGEFEVIAPEEWWRRIARLHAEHHLACLAVPEVERRRLDKLRGRVDWLQRPLFDLPDALPLERP